MIADAIATKAAKAPHGKRLRLLEAARLARTGDLLRDQGNVAKAKPYFEATLKLLVGEK